MELSESKAANFEFISFTLTDGVIFGLSGGSLTSKPSVALVVCNSFWTVVGTLLKEGSVEKIYGAF